MNILITNDDGIRADGIIELAKELAKTHNIYVVAPDTQRSATGHAITIHNPIMVNKEYIDDNISAYSISGTPADCVKVGVEALFKEVNIDMVLSGINNGPNLGTDVIYSGTVSAAMEGAILGIPSVAVSNIAWKPNCFEAAVSGAKYAASLLMCMPELRLLNVNAPDLSLAQVKGVRFTPAGVQEYETHYDERMDPYGQKYYWLPAGRKSQCDAEADCDEAWTNRGYIAITPIVTNMTDETTLARLRAKQNEITLKL